MMQIGGRSCGHTEDGGRTTSAPDNAVRLAAKRVTLRLATRKVASAGFHRQGVADKNCGPKLPANAGGGVGNRAAAVHHVFGGE